MKRQNLKERLQKLAGVIKEQTTDLDVYPNPMNCDEWFDINYGDWGTLEGLVPQVNYSFEEGADNINSIFTSNSNNQGTSLMDCNQNLFSGVNIPGNWSMQGIANWALAAAYNGEIGYDQEWRRIMWTNSQASTPTGPYMYPGINTFNGITPPIGPCTYPPTGGTYRMFASVTLDWGEGVINNPSWSQVFEAINNQIPDYLLSQLGEWWTNYSSIEELNEFLAFVNAITIDDTNFLCSAGGSCIKTCMCQCFEEECVNGEAACQATIGCNDPQAANYVEGASPDNPCIRWVTGGGPVSATNPLFVSYHHHVNNGHWSDSSMESFPEMEGGNMGCNGYSVGCTNINAPNFDTNITENLLGDINTDISNNSISVYSSTYEIYGTGINLWDSCNGTNNLQDWIDCFVNWGIIVNDGTECEDPIYGCMDEEAFNYNPEAFYDDPESCVPIATGCTDVEAENHNPEANTDDESCIYLEDVCLESANTLFPTGYDQDTINTVCTNFCTPVYGDNYTFDWMTYGSGEGGFGGGSGEGENPVLAEFCTIGCCELEYQSTVPEDEVEEEFTWTGCDSFEGWLEDVSMQDGEGITEEVFCNNCFENISMGEATQLWGEFFSEQCSCCEGWEEHLLAEACGEIPSNYITVYCAGEIDALVTYIGSMYPNVAQCCGTEPQGMPAPDIEAMARELGISLDDKTTSKNSETDRMKKLAGIQPKTDLKK